MLQGWRGNCDLQVLLYNCDPKNPDPSEIARVTDYVASYSTKGNATLKEEREHTRNFIMNSEEFTGDSRDIERVCKQIMNKTASQRIISKQECMVLLADMPLIECTEKFETVPLSLSRKLSLNKESSSDQKKFIQQHIDRPPCYENLSMHQFFHVVKNYDMTKKNARGGYTIVPNFVGITGVPRFPVTEDYARHTLVVHCPWRKYPTNLDWILEFNRFIKSPFCPLAATLPYERVMRRHYDNMTGYEPKTAKVDHSANPISDNDRDILEIVGLHDSEEPDEDTAMLKKIDYGKTHEWDVPPKVSHKTIDSGMCFRF